MNVWQSRLKSFSQVPPPAAGNVATPIKRPERLHWVRAIFYLHLAIVCLSVPIIWCHVSRYYWFPFLYFKLHIIFNAHAFLFLAIPIAIAFAGWRSHVRSKNWLPYVILDLILSLIHMFWISFLIPL